MTGDTRVIASTTCTICDRGRLSVPALVAMNERCVCSECAFLAVDALVEHYGVETLRAVTGDHRQVLRSAAA